ncbi:MAG: tetratricopeptide repeat protein, partial [Candidatus Gastranaerophilales bacterium]|nr:tetratricopeptide repeat protein [Candidatus Gastranaerophilales bacterium]
YLGLADSCFALNMNTYAKNYYEQTLNIDSENIEVLTKYAQVLYELKEYDLSLAILDKLTDVNPNDDKSFYNKALIKYNNKDYQNAYTDLISAIQVKDNNADYYYLAGMICEAQDKTQEAVAFYEKFLAFSTDETLNAKIKSKTKVMYNGLNKND